MHSRPPPLLVPYPRARPTHKAISQAALTQARPRGCEPRRASGPSPARRAPDGPVKQAAHTPADGRQTRKTDAPASPATPKARRSIDRIPPPLEASPHCPAIRLRGHRRRVFADVVGVEPALVHCPAPAFLPVARLLRFGLPLGRNGYYN